MWLLMDQVIAVDDLSGGFMENIPEGVHFVQGDLKDEKFVADLFKAYGPFDYVYHLAAYAAEGLSHFIR
jgi:UDP-glucose 4-epimerase